MSKTIYKYPLKITDTQYITVPFGGYPISVATQHGEPVVWFMVNTTNSATERYRFVMIGTGNPAGHAEGMDFLGTVLMANDALVWHLFYACEGEDK